MNRLLPNTTFLTLHGLITVECCAGPMLACGVRTPKNNTMPGLRSMPQDRARNEQAAVAA